MAAEATCWLCGAAYRSSVTSCLDCGLDLVPPTAEQRRIRELADERLSRRAFDRVRPSLAALPDVLVDAEEVVDLTDARHAGRPGLVAVTTQALCWVPVDTEADAGAIDLGSIQQVGTWPGSGGQLRIDTASDLHVFADVGTERRLGELAESLRGQMRALALRTWGEG